MGATENKATMSRVVEEVFNKQNLKLMSEVCAPNYVFHAPDGQDVVGAEGFQGMLAMYFSAFPDMKMEAHDIVSDGDCVACRFTLTGTHTGDLMGIPPTNKQFNYKATVVIHFEDGKEAEAWEYADPNAVFTQLGISPPQG